jgi:hypothetical protein
MAGGTKLLVMLAWTLAIPARLSAQASDAAPRRLSAEETHCDTTRRQPTDTVYAFDQVDEQVKPTYLTIEDMPLRVREVLAGRSVFRFVVEPSGDINRCTIELVEENDPVWTAAVLKKLRGARYRPARRAGQTVRQLVYQIFTYNEDGRFLHGR